MERQDEVLLEMIEGRYGVDWNKYISGAGLAGTGLQRECRALQADVASCTKNLINNREVISRVPRMFFLTFLNVVTTQTPKLSYVFDQI